LERRSTVKHLYNQGKSLSDQIRNTDMQEGTVAIWHLGQSGVVIKGKASDGALVIDPYLTYSIEQTNPETEFKRVFPPPVSPNELKAISGVLVTHYHDDHMDLATLSELMSSNDEAVVSLPASHSHLLHDYENARNVRPIIDETTFKINGFTITPIPVAHTNYETDENGYSLYYGYFIEVNGVRLFHSGDTIVTDHIVEKARDFHPDIVFLPINGGDYARTRRGIIGNMGYREAADFASEVGADLVLPIHYDLFPSNRDNPSYFVDYLFYHYPSQKFHMLVPGERFIYFK
jgi:L-ascorbate 6-phosphate lactonase